MTPKVRGVFISYSHKDHEFVNSFASALLKLDINVWKDSKDIPVGGNIPKSIYDGIKSASHFCCVVSLASINSKWVEEELSFAKVRQLSDIGLSLVPILIDKVDIPDYLKAYRCAHLEDRNLSFDNPEFAAVLKAFGADVGKYLREVLTGEARVRVLSASVDLQEKLSPFRAALAVLEGRYAQYNIAQVNPLPGALFELRPLERTMERRLEEQLVKHIANGQVREALENYRAALEEVKRKASDVSVSVEELRRVVEDVDPEMTGPSLHRLRAFGTLGLVAYVAKEASDPSDEMPWWIREKLSTWVQDLVRFEQTLEGMIALLHSWAMFDPSAEAEAQ